MADRPETELETAVRHVAEGRQRVAEQRVRIAKLEAGGHPILDHQQTLLVLESTQKIFEEHEQSIRNRISK